MAKPYVIDTSDVLPTLKALQRVEKDVRQNANRRLRQAASTCAGGLVSALRLQAALAATPQARIVAETARVKSDRVPSVTVGGGQGVGRHGTAAGVLVWGSERGGRTFAAPTGGSYWIGPAVDRYSRGPAVEAYKRAVAQILSDAGL